MSMIGIGPPEYFPRLEYMSLVQHVDQFVFADTIPFRNETFHHRTKLRESDGWHWITIPIFGNRDGAPIHTVRIETGGRWREKHWRSFLYDYRTTMYFEYFERSFHPFFEYEWESLGDCLCRSVEVSAELFGMGTSFRRASSLPGSPADFGEIVGALNAHTVVVPAWFAQGAASTSPVEIFQYEHPTYRQNFEGFEPGMTAVDLAFNYGPEARRILASGVHETTSRSTF